MADERTDDQHHRQVSGDKDAASEEARAEGATAEEAEPDVGSAEGAAGAGFGPQAPPEDTDVFDMLRAAIGLFAQEGWIALGLQPRYGSDETEMDLGCARVAIDTTGMLVEQLGDEATDEEKREFERTLTDLRVNFMRRKKKAEEEAEE